MNHATRGIKIKLPWISNISNLHFNGVHFSLIKFSIITFWVNNVTVKSKVLHCGVNVDIGVSNIVIF